MTPVPPWALAPVLGAVLAPDPVTREGAREAARRELSRPAYHRDDPGLTEQVLRTAGRWVGALFERAAAAAPGGGIGALLLVALLAAAVLAVRSRTGPVRTSGRSSTLLGQPAATAADHRRAATEHGAAGRYAPAVREHVRAIARDAESRGMLAARAGRTADELAADLGAALPDCAVALREVARTFDEIWYGGRPASLADYRRAAEVDETVRSASRPAVAPAVVAPAR